MGVVCAGGLDKRARGLEISVAAGTRWSEGSWTGAEERCRGGRAVRRGQPLQARLGFVEGGLRGSGYGARVSCRAMKRKVVVDEVVSCRIARQELLVIFAVKRFSAKTASSLR